MVDEEHVVETPWGKLVTAKGLNILLSSFTNDINRLHSAFTQLDKKLNELESTLNNSKTTTTDTLLNSSFASVEKEIQQLKIEQSRFAEHMKKTLELFYSKLEQVTQ
jgi:predicted nuclease with TOPRIM domain